VCIVYIKQMNVVYIHFRDQIVDDDGLSDGLLLLLIVNIQYLRLFLNFKFYVCHCSQVNCLSLVMFLFQLPNCLLTELVGDQICIRKRNLF
jgi:hypothetical protein